jgi:hypothetical protein
MEQMHTITTSNHIAITVAQNKILGELKIQVDTIKDEKKKTVSNMKKNMKQTSYYEKCVVTMTSNKHCPNLQRREGLNDNCPKLY